MTVDRAAIRRAAYLPFLEPEPEDGGAPTAPETYHDVPDGHPADITRAELAGMFGADTEHHLSRIGLRVDGVIVGNVTRDTVLAKENFAGSDIGGGDGLTFPMDSSEFRALRFHCEAVKKGPKCLRLAFAFYYDERDFPKCPDHHVDMVLIQN